MGSRYVSLVTRVRHGLAGIAAVSVLTLGASPVSGAPPVFGPASPLSSTAAIDGATDAPPVLAAGRNGTWVAVWESNDSLGGTIGSDTDILFSRTVDGGATWSATAPLDPLAASDTAADGTPALASDGHGTWVAVWRSNRRIGTSGGDLDILFARSTDDGVTWSPSAQLHSAFASDTHPDDQPTIAADGQGGWVVAWRSSNGDTDIYSARSVDGGATWSAPAPLNQNAATDTGTDQLPALAADGSGTWIAVWTSTDPLGGTIGADQDILFARSTDGGLTWTEPRPVHANAGSDVGFDTAPAIASDGAAGWIVAWQSNDSLGGTIGTDYDVLAVRSSDGGVTWSNPAPVSGYAATDTAVDTAPTVACGGARRCAVAWQSTESLGNTIGTDLDVLFTETEDGGATWSAPAALDPRAALDTGADQEPVLVADGRGTWIAVWQSNDSFGGTIGTDFDPLVAVGLEPPVCGDGVLHAQEACDDGNTLPGDGCRSDCTLEVCGDAILDPGESCDDGNVSSGDGCRSDCTLEICGDAIVDPGEACDDGNASSGDGCRADCSAEICGDAILDPGEACDDGNTSSGDGCDASCHVETAPPTTPPPQEVQSLLEFFDAASVDGTLVGTGRLRAAGERLRLMRLWLDVAVRKLDDGHLRGGCTLLAIALQRVDGHRRPPDFATGPAAPELARRIEELREDSSCPPSHLTQKWRDDPD